MTNPLPVLTCTSAGAPGEISWNYAGSSRTYVTDSDHQIEQSLLNGMSSMFKSRLSFLRHPYSRDTGERVCTVTSTYVSANSTETNTSTVTGNLACHPWILKEYYIAIVS